MMGSARPRRAADAACGSMEPLEHNHQCHQFTHVVNICATLSTWRRYAQPSHVGERSAFTNVPEAPEGLKKPECNYSRINQAWFARWFVQCEPCRRHGFYSPRCARYKPLREPKSVNLARNAAYLGFAARFRPIQEAAMSYPHLPRRGGSTRLPIPLPHGALSGVPRQSDPAPKSRCNTKRQRGRRHGPV